MVSITLNAHLLSAQASYRSAGIHGYIYNTLLHLPDAAPDYQFHVLVGDGNPPPHPRLSVHRSSFSTASPLRRILWEQVAQPRTVRRLQPDVHHGMAFVAPNHLPMPTIVTVYDLSFLRFPQGLSQTRRAYLTRFTRQSCQQAARIIAISQSTAQDLVTLMGIPAEKIKVATPGIGEAFSPLDDAHIAAFREAHQLPERFLLHVGTLEPRKNLPMLLRAYAALPNRLRQEVHLVLAGGKGWDYEDIFAAIAQNDLADTVHLPGFVSNDDLPLWYNAAEAFVYPSVYEGWGLPVTEAMACGCPTLVSDVSSLPEAVGNTGMRLPPNNEIAWTEALEMVISDETWRHTSSEAGKARARQFTWQATAKAHIHAYRAAME